MKDEKQYYVTVKSEKVEVSEEVYRAYVRPIRAEQRQRRRDWKCKIRGPKGNLIRCPYNCADCEFAKSGRNATGNSLSLDAMKESQQEVEDRGFDLETMTIEKEEKEEEREKLYKAISTLTPRQKEMVNYIFFQKKDQEFLAKRYGVKKAAISNAMQRIYTALKKYLQEN